MKNKLMKVLAMVMVVGSILTACGGATKPSGTYADSNASMFSSSVSFNFGDETVIVTEGSANVTCDYEIDDEGNITFELEGDTLTCTYDEEHDVIYFMGEMYTK